MTTRASGTLHILDDAAEVGCAAARRFVQLATQSVARSGRFNVALSGGAAPRSLYASLATEFSRSVPWEHVHFYWSDERCVSPRHADSNYGMAKRLLLDLVGVQPERVHPIAGTLTPQLAAANYRQVLEELPLSPTGVPVFDLILLGIGADGHTASLFPQFRQLLLNERHAWVVAVPRSDAHPWERVTLTLDVINGSNHVAFLALGSRKAMALKLALEGPALDVPASLVRPHGGSVEWYLDRPASIALTPEATV